MAKAKKILLWAILGSVGLYLLSFLMYFVPYYVMETDINSEGLKIYEYIRTFVARFLEFAIPAVACAAVYFCESAQSVGKAILKCLYIALGKLVYLIPYYYLWFMEISGGNDSGEAIAMACLSSLFDLVIFWAHIMLLYAALRFIAKHLVWAKALKALTPQKREKLSKQDKKQMMLCAKAEIDAFPEISSAFDFSYPLCVALFSVSFIQFFLYLVQEVITSVDYLISFAGYYRTGEIVYMIISFLFILLCMLATHIIIHRFSILSREKDAVI